MYNSIASCGGILQEYGYKYGCNCYSQQEADDSMNYCEGYNKKITE
jgi:hypothetical protein